MSICERCWELGGSTQDGYEAEIVRHHNPEHDVAALRARLAEVARERDEWQRTAEEGSWPYEWEVATRIREQRDSANAIAAEAVRLLAFLNNERGCGCCGGDRLFEAVEAVLAFVKRPDIAAILRGSKP